MKTLFLALEDFRTRDRGSRIRDWYVVDALASLGEVTVVCFHPESAIEQRHDIPGVTIRSAPPVRKPSALLRSLIRRTMYHVERYDFSIHPALVDIRREDFDLVVASQLYPMAHLPSITSTGAAHRPVIWDTHNFDPAVWEERRRHGSLLRRLFASVSGAIATALINKALETADVLLACTQPDLDAWAELADGSKVTLIPNGAEIESWEEVRATFGDPNRFVLFGSLSQESTAAGADWFLNRVWPRYLDSYPQAQLTIAGRNPSSGLMKTARSVGAEVVANPPDLRPVVKAAATVVVPQVWGTGSKLKVLEALASGRRVVASPAAVVGLPAELTGYVDQAEGLAEWLGLMNERTAEARSATERSELRHLLDDWASWSASQRRLVELVVELVRP